MPFCRTTLKAAWLPVSYPKECKHLGDHIKRRRLDLGLTRGEAAHQIGVDKDTLLRWESGAFRPTVRRLPKVLEFLGYDPSGGNRSFAQRLVSSRRRLGVSQAALARMLGVASRTVWRWEAQGVLPSPPLKARLEEMLFG